MVQRRTAPCTAAALTRLLWHPPPLRSHNPDLAAAGLKNGADLWGHYVGFGQFEQRPVK